MVRYRIDKVQVGQPQVRRGTWTFARLMTRGSEHIYQVVDGNHVQRNRWEFVVRVPDAATGRVQIQPVKVPNDTAYAGLDRRTLTFMRGTRPGYTSFRYCQLSLSRPGGEGTRDVVHRGERGLLPYWLRRLGWRLRQKATVRRTRGTDARSVVVLVRPEDHQMMIRVFFASKVWILKQGISLQQG